MNVKKKVESVTSEIHAVLTGENRFTVSGGPFCRERQMGVHIS